MKGRSRPGPRLDKRDRTRSLNMATDGPSNTDFADELVWEQIERSLELLSRSAESVQEPAAFYELFLDQVASLLAAQLAAVWRRDSLSSTPTLVAHSGFMAGPRPQAPPHVLDAFATSIATSQAIDAPGLKGLELVQPVTTAQGQTAVVHLVVHSLDADSQAAIRRLLDLLTEIAQAFERRLESARQSTGAGELQKRLEFVRAVHRSLELDSTALAIVNELRRHSQADRVSLLCADGARWRVQAVSGVDTPRPQSPELKSMQRLAQTFAQLAEPRWVSVGESLDSFPPEIERALAEYWDQCSARTVGILPLPGIEGEGGAGSPYGDASVTGESTAPVTSLLIIEQYQRELPASSRQFLEGSVSDASRAILHAFHLQRLPFRRLGRAWARLWGQWGRGTRQRLGVGVALATLALLALLLIPKTLFITAEGQLLPEDHRLLFAPETAQIQQILVKHGDQVRKGQSLMVLRSMELELEYEKARRELNESRERLRVLEERVFEDRDLEDNLADLNAERLELRAAVPVLELQLNELQQSLEQLTIKAPIDGIVLDWDLDRQLRNRPVAQGEVILRVGDTEGDWLAELAIDPRDLGPVLAARTAGHPVVVLMEADPTVQFAGVLSEISRSTSGSDKRPGQVPAIAELDLPAKARLQPGARVRCSVNCGRHRLGYVWFREVIQAVRLWLVV